MERSTDKDKQTEEKTDKPYRIELVEDRLTGSLEEMIVYEE